MILFYKYVGNNTAQKLRERTMTENPAIIEILQETRRVLAFHHSLGIDAYPTIAGIQSLLADPVSPATGAIAPSAAPRQPIAESVPRPELPNDDATLEDIRLDLGNCDRCALKASRDKIVFGVGNAKADLFIVGEWPDPEANATGTPFSGESGALLDRMLAAIGMTRAQVYLTDMVKCHPAQGQVPEEDAIRACRPFLLRQIAVVKPKVILAMGPLAAQALLKTNNPLSRLRGRFHTFHGIDLMPTFHPDFLIANPDMKKATWLDLQMVQKRCLQGS